MKTITLFVFSSIALFLLVGCGASEPSKTEQLSEAAQAFTDLAKVAETAQKAGPNNPEATVQTMEQVAAIGAAFEVKEFEKIESVDLPTDFPTAFVYKNGKITSSHENSSEGNQDQDIEIKTLDEVAKIREFYKAALGTDGWKLGSQENTSGGSEYSASTEDGGYVTVDISSNPYSKLAEIRVNYSKSSQQ